MIISGVDLCSRSGDMRLGLSNLTRSDRIRRHALPGLGTRSGNDGELGASVIDGMRVIEIADTEAHARGWGEVDAERYEAKPFFS